MISSVTPLFQIVPPLVESRRRGQASKIVGLPFLGIAQDGVSNRNALVLVETGMDRVVKVVKVKWRRVTTQNLESIGVHDRIPY